MYFIIQFKSIRNNFYLHPSWFSISCNEIIQYIDPRISFLIHKLFIIKLMTTRGNRASIKLTVEILHFAEWGKTDSILLPEQRDQLPAQPHNFGVGDKERKNTLTKIDCSPSTKNVPLGSSQLFPSKETLLSLRRFNSVAEIQIFITRYTTKVWKAARIVEPEPITSSPTVFLRGGDVQLS